MGRVLPLAELLLREAVRYSVGDMGTCRALRGTRGAPMQIWRRAIVMLGRLNAGNFREIHCGLKSTLMLSSENGERVFCSEFPR